MNKIVEKLINGHSRYPQSDILAILQMAAFELSIRHPSMYTDDIVHVPDWSKLQSITKVEVEDIALKISKLLNDNEVIKLYKIGTIGTSVDFKLLFDFDATITLALVVEDGYKSTIVEYGDVYGSMEGYRNMHAKLAIIKPKLLELLTPEIRPYDPFDL